MIEQAIKALMDSNSALQTLIDGRAFGLMAEEEVLSPYIVYNKVSTVQRSSLCASDGIAMSVFQFDSYATGYEEVKLVANALKNCLIDFRGTVAGTRIKTVKLENETDLLDVDPGFYRVLHLFIFWHEV